MASMKVHVLKALKNRTAAEQAHAAALQRQAKITAARAKLDQGVADAAKVAGQATMPALPGGKQ